MINQWATAGRPAMVSDHHRSPPYFNGLGGLEMKKRKDYSSQRLDPRWQKRRLEIMNRDNFECQECGDKEKTLNVHHVYYTDGADVWDYPDSALVTLCCDCHEFEHQTSRVVEKELIDNLKKLGFRSSRIGGLAFTVEMARVNIGEEASKKLFDQLDLIASRASFDPMVIELIDSMVSEIYSKGFVENA